MKISLNNEELEIIEYLSRKPWKIYIVGGFVRDTLLGTPPKDADFVVDAPFNEVLHYLKQKYTVSKDGIPFKTAKVHVNSKRIDITVPRREIYEGPAVTELETGSIEEDLSRRDFTINAMAIDVNTGNLIDKFNGIKDINTKIIRFVGDPDERIREDPLRILRALRFASILSFKIEFNTLMALRRNISLLNYVSGERIRDEIIKAAPAFLKLFDRVISIGAGNVVFGIDEKVWNSVKHDTRGHHYGESLLDHSRDLLRYIEGIERINNITIPIEVKLAALYHDSGKIATMKIEGNKITFHDHPRYSKIFAQPIIHKFHFNKATENHILFLIAGHMRFTNLKTQKYSTIAKYIIDARIHHIPLQWMLNLATLSHVDGHEAPPSSLIKKLYEVDRPKGNRFLNIAPEYRSNSVRSEWIKIATEVVRNNLMEVINNDGIDTR
ncbi:MAG: CCA tRNA nucleotidyltransferase [Nitrososphaerota archaeon]